MIDFASMIAALRPDGEGFAIETAEAWAQGRTLYGGMTAALAHAAALRACPGLPPLRAMQCAFAGPATGRLRFTPALLRRGRSAASLAVDCASADGIAARLSFVFGAPRDSVVAHARIVPPAAPPPDACPRFHRTEKPLPGFLGRFEFRLATGSRLFDPDATPGFGIWVRFADGGGEADPVTALLAVADAAPCAAMVAFPRPAPVSTMTWGVEVAAAAPPPADGWYLVSSESEQAGDGYSLQAMRVHAADGALLLTGRQLVAVFA